MSLAAELLNQLDDPQKRFSALLLLGRIRYLPALPRLLAFITDADRSTRWAAAYALGLLGDASAIDALLPLLNDDDEQVRLAANRALGNLRRQTTDQLEVVEERSPEQLNDEYEADVLNWLMDAMNRAAGTQRGFITLRNRDTGKLDYEASSGMADQPTVNELVEANASLLNEVATNKQPVITNNAAMDARFQAGSSIIMRGLRAVIAVPMVVNDDVVGVIYGDNSIKTGLASTEQLEAVRVLAEQAATALVVPLMVEPRGGGLDLLEEAPLEQEQWQSAEPPLDGAPPVEIELEKSARAEDEGGETASQVQFSAYYPPEAQIERRHGLFVYAHVPDAFSAIGEDVQRFREELGGQVRAPKVAKQTALLKVDTPITVTPECDGLEFEPPTLTKKWHEDWVRFDFEFRAPAKLVGESLLVRVSVQVGAVEIAHISVPLELVEQLATPAETPAENPLAAAKLSCKTGTLYQRIFISYSRRDQAVAEQYRLAQLALGNDVFMDSYSIRVGENWRAALARAIDDAEIFQLFWSQHSSESENVRNEWDYALHHRCADTGCESFIRPVFWAKPMPTPPNELSHLNFRFVPLSE